MKKTFFTEDKPSIGKLHRETVQSPSLEDDSTRPNWSKLSAC